MDKLPSAYMKAPDHCQEVRMVCRDLGDMICVDTVICYWYCQCQCQEFIDFCEQNKEEKVRKWKKEKKERRIIMAARAELLQICDELGIDSEDLSIEELTSAIREKADKKFKKKKKISADNMSEALKKFLLKEYDFVIKDKDGNELNYRGKKIKGDKPKKIKKKNKKLDK